MTTPQPAHHVVMLVGNDVTVDTRVKKMAATLAADGLRVTVLGLSTTARRAESDLHGARIILLPVVYALRDARTMQRRVPSLAYRSKREVVVAKRRRKLMERETAAAVARARVRLAALDPAGAPRERAGRLVLVGTIRARRLAVKVRRKAVAVREALYQRRLHREPWPGETLVRAAVLAVTRLQLEDWRRALPYIQDYELAFGPVLDELAPDVVHAHDVHLIGVAERSVARARAAGRPVRWIYDAHEYIPGLARYAGRELGGYIDLEREYIRRADRVITVAEPIADILERTFRLPRRPTVVLNVPVVADLAEEKLPSVRRASGLSADVPLVVYSGGIDRTRGVQTLVEAMPLLPGVHVALVSRSGHVAHLELRAAQLGCRDRLHIVPFVPNDEVPAYLSSATVGIHTLTHYGNHEVALPNKLFDYLHARLPVVVSDVRAMAELTTELGIGEVFTADDPRSLATALLTVLADPGSYARVYRDRPEILERYSWRREQHNLTRLYRDLLGDAYPAAPGHVPAPPAPAPPPPRAGTSHVGIGPRNMAGQGWAWAKSIEQWCPGTTTEVFALERSSALVFPADVQIPQASWKDLDWQFAQVRKIVGRSTHLLLECGQGAFGTLNGGTFAGDLPALRAHGVAAAVVLHGSEARSPRLHRGLEPWSPFASEVPDSSLPRQDVVDKVLDLVHRFDGPRFVSTLDLVDYVPDAEWLPVVVDPAIWAVDGEPLHRDRPVVVHAPSHTLLKGSAAVDAVAEELAARGVIEYRRLRDVAPQDMPGALAGADVVLDQFALGDYGVLACQAMAAGRVVVGHVADRVRKRLPAELPIVQATPADLREVLLRVVEERDAARSTAAQGVEYAHRYHDGRHSVEQLRPFLTEVQR